MSALAHLLEVRRAELLHRWSERVQRDLAPRPLTRPELVDSLPHFLAGLVSTLRRPADAGDARLSPAVVVGGAAHGEQRYREGFLLEAIIEEYGLLHECVVELAREEGCALTLDEVSVLSRCITLGVGEAVRHYARERERTLRESESRLQAIIDNAPAAIYVKDLEGRCLIVNRRLERILGRPRQEILGKDDHALLPKEVADLTRANDLRMLAANASLEVEEVLPQEDGPHTYLAQKFLLRDAEGRPYALCGISTDITERRRAQEALKETQERLRTVLSHLPIVLWAINAEGLITLSEGRGLEGFGLERGQQVGQSVFEVYEDLPWVLANVRRALAGETFTDELESSGRWFESHYQPYRHDGGEVGGAIALAVEVTERKQAEAFHQRLLGIVSHDIRNPLSSITLSSALLLKRESLTPGQLHAVQRIAQGAERIEKLVAMLLDFSLAQFGQGLPLKREHTCLHDVGSRVLDELQALHPQRELRCEASGDTCGEWDPNRLTQVVDNLLGNALRYSAADSPVRAVYRGEPGRVVFQTHNLGPPIPETLLPHLFEPFRRGEHAAKKEGLGLGLYIVREVVEAHGGTIQVESSAEAGTTFTVHLPRKPPA